MTPLPMLQTPPPAPAKRARNLLALAPVAAIARSRLFPAMLQWATAAVFAVIMWQLLLGPDTAHDNAGTALVWVLWWPLLPLLFITFGRFWCAICPFGWLSDQVQKLVGVHRRAPKFLKKWGIWLIDACFIAVTWADHVFGVVESPWGSGVLLLGMLTAVVISGAFYERRTFCRYLCFLGGVASNYSRAGMLALRANPEVCKTCKAKAACLNGAAAPGCPMFEFPRQMDTSANCTLCANCIKNCPNDAISLTIRPPTRELWSVTKPRIEVAFLAAAIMGIVFIQNVTMLNIWEAIRGFLERLTGTANAAVIYTLLFALAIGATVALLAGASALAARVNEEGVWKNFARFGYALIPLDVAGHIAHNLFHLLAEGKGVVYTVAALFGAGPNDGSTALLSTPAIQALQYLVVGLGVAGSGYCTYRIATRGRVAGRRVWAQLAPYLVLIAMFAALNAVLFALPMVHRM